MKFKKGNIIVHKNYLEEHYEIIEITRDSEKLVKGNWWNGPKELLVPPNSYILKYLEDNYFYYNRIELVEKYYKLLQKVNSQYKTRWISIKENILPKNRQTVLITTEFPNGTRFIDLVEYVEEDNCFVDSENYVLPFDESCKIVAWSLAPKPYEGE